MNLSSLSTILLTLALSSCGSYEDYIEENEETSKEEPITEEIYDEEQDVHVTVEVDVAVTVNPEDEETYEGLLRRGLTMYEVSDILGEPDNSVDRVSFGKIWKYDYSSGVCGTDRRFSNCAVIFDSNYELESTSNIAARYKDHYN